MRKLLKLIVLWALPCLLGLQSSAGVQQAPNSCVGTASSLVETVSRVRDGRSLDVPVWHLADSETFFFVSGMTVDADGALTAYHPEDTGLDELANAGVPGHWDGIVTGRDGNPLIQKDTDPFPGYYVSCTSLADETKAFSDPTAYVNALTIPYIALPEHLAQRGGMRLGDFAFVKNLRNGKSSFAIYADVGTLGEGSVALANTLGIPSSARDGGAPAEILYMLFPGSGNLRPRSLKEIQNEGEKLLASRDGANNLLSCAADKMPSLK